MTQKQKFFEGTVTKADLRMWYDPADNYYGSPNSKTERVRVMIALDTADGPVWFYTPHTYRTIGLTSGHAVLSVIESDWVGSKPANRDKVVGVTPDSKVKVGQTLRIKARVKKQTKYGPQLYYAKLDK